MGELSSALATPWFRFDPPQSLTFKKESGSLGAQLSYKFSKDFFDASGSKNTALSDGSEQHYHDFVSLFQGAYGLTDRLTLWLAIPFVFRKETSSFDAKDTGLGDVEAGARYLVWKSPSEFFQVAFDLFTKSPSGDTNVSFSDPSRGIEPELPLGKGTIDVGLAASALQKLKSTIQIQEWVGYVFRLSALVEYLATTSLIFSDSQGNLFSLPVGNLRINWGDEIHTGIRFSWNFFRKTTFISDVNYLYRGNSTIGDFQLTTVGSITESTPVELNLASAYFLSITPGFIFKIQDQLKLQVAVEIPLFGESYPTLPLAFVESMTGNLYQLGISYEF